MASAQPACYRPLLGETTGLLALRVQGTEHDGRVLHIRSSKCLIGSDPTCTLRLRSASVRPFHCLILRGAAGTFIRRWSPDTCLNGCGFDEARLNPGDRISIGAIELEVLPSTPLAVSASPIAPPTDRDQNETFQLESVQECQRLRDELHDMWQEHQRLQALVQQQEQKDRETEVGYLTLIEELRSAITSSKMVCHDQLIEHRTLASQAEAAAGQLELLRDDVDRLRNELDAERCLSSNALTYLEAERVQGEAFRQEIETLRFQVMQAAARAADQDVSPPPPPPQPVPGECSADIATWKDVTDGLRRELQQTREEHRRVREEWHVDRESLERELNSHSTAVQHLEQKYRQDMYEAEMLIHAMQQEGKHLLVQLDEVKQSIRQGADGQKKKRPSLVRTVQSLVADAASPLPPNVSDKPPADNPPLAPSTMPKSAPPSACPTMLMEESPPAAEADTPSVGKPAGDVSPVAAGDPEPDDDEGAIQRYMERLLHRVARIPEVRVSEDGVSEDGVSEDRDASPPRAALPALTRMEAAPVREAVLVAPATSAAQEACQGSESETMPATAPVPLAPPEPVQPRAAIPPELAADLLALRQLADRTTPRHVDRSGDRQRTVAAVGDLVVAFVCLAFGVLASARGSGVLSAETLGGAIGIGFGIISLLRGLRTCVHLQRKRSEARMGGTE